jgi:anti-sigma regulatory factor (Ser/Thr protein kinase)
MEERPTVLRQAAFTAELSSIRAARRFVARELDGVADVDVVVLLVSELATNAVCHAGSDFTVRLHIHPSSVTVDVEDQSPIPPRVRDVDHDTTSGRGLRLVEELASDWGIEALTQGKRVWFELRYG